MISRFFIDRPIFATVLSVIILLCGLASVRSLPVAQYPDIVPPEVVVTANYPGADAAVIASTVAAPLEQSINGVERMIYMRSSSSNTGLLTLTITFEVGTDPDKAVINVNNKVQSALARLPDEVRRQGIIVNKRSSAILQVVTMFSPDSRFDTTYISNYALLNIIDQIKRIKGVGDATLFGARDYAIRIWLRPDKLAHHKLTPADVAAAISEQNSQFAAGQFGQEPNKNSLDFTYSVVTQGRFSDPKEFENIILRADSNGSTLRIKDVARVELGGQDYSLKASADGKPAVAFGIYLQPGAVAVTTTSDVEKKMAEISKAFPAGLSYSILFDTTKFVTNSIEEVVYTFLEAIALVVFVVYIFLQNGRATLIPMIAVPISLIGTFAGMYVLGFSINLLTLFGMVLSIGIVVDDAIVVLENFERIMTTEKLSPREAAIKAMEEVTGPIIAIVLVLCAVFIPVAFIGRLTGEMYKQFAITIALSVAISGIVALTLSPTLCALFIKPMNHGTISSPTHSIGTLRKLLNKFNREFEILTDKYLQGVQLLLRRPVLGMLLFLGVVGSTVLMLKITPTSLVPEEDQGYIMVLSTLMPGASLERTDQVTGLMTQRIMKQPEVSNVLTFAGFDLFSGSQKSNTGVSFVPLKDWKQRKAPQSDARAIAGRLMGMGADVKDGFVFAINPPPITGISMTGGFEFYLQNSSGQDIQTIAKTVGAFIAIANKQPELKNIKMTTSVNVPQYFADLDRVKAKALGIPINSLFATMQSTFGTYYVNDFSLYGRIFRVLLQSEAEFRESPEHLKHVFVRSQAGNMISLESLIRMKRTVGPDLVERFNGFPAVKIMGEPGLGYSSGQALAAIEKIAAENLSEDYHLSWTGASYQEKAASSSTSVIFVIGVLMVFLILAALYERWTLPFAVIAAVPFAVFGAILAILMRNLNNDLYFQVGLLTLVGLSAKNAILIVEFAVMHRASGKSIMESILTAARLRFRPIIMTSFAFIFGCVPLALATGAGAGSRHSIGTGVIGGMLTATLIATLFVPLFYMLVEQLGSKKPTAAETKEI